MKLYIPTTTYNFKDIMTNESISPVKFYEHRGFSFNHTQKVEPNDLDNRIILYDKYPDFDIINSPYAEFPLVIEVTVSDNSIHKYKDGIFYTEETIYLNPFSTRIFFENEKILKETLCEHTDRSCFKGIYKFFAKCSHEETIDFFKWEKTNNDIPDSSDINFDNIISKDKKIDKLKGLLYAYFFGANRSLPHGIVTLRKNTKKIYNSSSSAVSQSLNLAKREEISHHTKDLSYIISKLESIKECAIENKTILELINKHVTENIAVKCLPTLQDCDKVRSIPADKTGFQKKLFNHYLKFIESEQWNSEAFLNYRSKFASEGEEFFKKELKNIWENSPYKSYFKRLKTNLNPSSNTSFDLNSIEDKEYSLPLKSLAAFCKKGKDDLTELEDYLISNGIGDFRISFALWGMVFGSSKIPKKISDDFFQSDEKYIKEVYKHIYEQIHGIKLDGKSEIKEKQEEATRDPAYSSEPVPTSPVPAETETPETFESEDQTAPSGQEPIAVDNGDLTSTEDVPSAPGPSDTEDVPTPASWTNRHNIRIDPEMIWKRERGDKQTLDEFAKANLENQDGGEIVFPKAFQVTQSNQTKREMVQLYKYLSQYGLKAKWNRDEKMFTLYYDDLDLRLEMQ